MSIEEAFWDASKEIADEKGVPLCDLVEKIDRERRQANLSSAIRLFVLDHYQSLAGN